MRKYRSFLILALVSGMAVSGCDSRSDYQGDGVLQDYGHRDARHRYVLTIGEIDLGAAGSFEFDISGLPDEDFVFGFDIELPHMAPDGRPQDHLPCNPNVQIRIRDRAHEREVLDLGGKLAEDWTWSLVRGESTAFVYIRAPVGQHFSPSSERQYGLNLTVSRPTEDACELGGVLLTKSTGWK